MQNKDIINENVITNNNNVRHSERSEESLSELPSSAQDDENNLTIKSYSPITLFPYYLKRRVAFTLAEVLITLGVIGVVAALVIPGVINGFKTKELETRFKKADSILTAAMRATMFEHGLTSFSDFAQYCYGAYCSETTYDDLKEFNETWRKQFNIVKVIDADDLRAYQLYYFFGNPDASYGYSLNFTNYRPWQSKEGFILPDGMFIGDIRFGRGSTPFHIIPEVVFDINGPVKGPNRFGYDLFIFTQFQSNIGHCASPLSSGHCGGYYEYARKDENPYDKSLGYWKSLYKSKDWWQKVKNN